MPTSTANVPAALRFVSVFGTMLLIAGVLSAESASQITQEEHESHHPGESEGPNNQSGGTNNSEGSSTKSESAPNTAGPAGMGGMMGDMGQMMENMGAPKPKQLYPSLMSFPDLSPEERQELEGQAHERMKLGTALMSQGLQDLSRTAASDDFVAMQKATNTLREGLSQFESGLAAHRALAEGKAPQNVALNWFKQEMNLTLPNGVALDAGPLGLSWFHLISMTLLTLFGVGMVVMYFFKMRRATYLLERFATSEGPSGIAAPSASRTSKAEFETAPGAVAAAGPLTAPLHPSPEDHECCGDGCIVCAGEESSNTSNVSTGLLPVVGKQLCRLRVARIQEETPEVKTFRFVACHGGGIPFSYLPGQFLTLKLTINDKTVRRSYTISSSPTQGYYCEITVKREAEGLVSRYLHDEIKVGDTLDVKAPSGKFTFTGTESDSIVLIAGGVGITPMMSITRALTDMAWQGDIHFIVACGNPSLFVFRSELEDLESRYSNLHVHAVMDQIDHNIGRYQCGRLTEMMLREWVPEIAKMRVHVCGPPPMMKAVLQMLDALNLPADQVHTEDFGSDKKPKASAEVAQAPPELPSAGANAATVTFALSDKSTVLLPDETILEASERIGVDIDYSCRVGNCGECRVKLLSGEVSMEEDSGLESGDREANIILACQAKSNSPVSIDA